MTQKIINKWAQEFTNVNNMNSNFSELYSNFTELDANVPPAIDSLVVVAAGDSITDGGWYTASGTTGAATGSGTIGTLIGFGPQLLVLAGSSIYIAGFNQPEWNGVKTVLTNNGTNITFTNATTLTAAPTSSLFIVTADGIQTNRNFLKQANGLMGLPFSRIYNRAISGSTSTTVLVRFADVIALRPNYIWLMIGINDINATVPNTTIIANIQACCAQALNIKATVLLSTLLPSTAAGITTAMKKQILALNGLIRKYAQQTAGIILIDSYQYAGDPLSATYAWKVAGHTIDGVHLTGYGATNTVTKAIFDQLNTKIGRPKKSLVAHGEDSYIADSTSQNLFYDPLVLNTLTSAITGFTGTGGTGNPVYHYFMRPARITGTPSASIGVVARADGFGNDQTVTITSTANNDIMSIGGSTNNWLDAPFTAAVGKTVKFKCAFSQTGVPVGTLAGMSLYVVTPNGMYYCIYGQSGSFVLANENSADMDTIIEGTPFVVPTGFPTGNGTSFNVLLKFAGNAAGAVFKFGRLSIDILN